MGNDYDARWQLQPSTILDQSVVLVVCALRGDFIAPATLLLSRKDSKEMIPTAYGQHYSFNDQHHAGSSPRLLRGYPHSATLSYGW